MNTSEQGVGYPCHALVPSSPGGNREEKGAESQEMLMRKS